MEVLAVIPARGGSKGIPGKNLRTVGGVPLVTRTIRAAKAAKLVSRVLVSTDSPAIEAAALMAGAEVVCRPSEISGDKASSESALIHALELLGKMEAYRPDILAFLQCTAPFMTSEDVDGVISMVADEGYDTAFGASQTHGFLWRRGERGDAEAINHSKGFRPMRQDRERQYLEAGSVYAMKTDGFLSARHRFFGRTGIFELPAEHLLEIDEPEDLQLAEALSTVRQKQAATAALPSPIDALVLDFDGVFTDNKVLVYEDGSEAVICSRSDGLGLATVQNDGVPILVISKERNPVVRARTAKLGLECIHGVDDKLPAMQHWLAARGLLIERTIYVGNDINDIDCIKAAGCGIAVADAHPEVRAVSDIQLNAPGGNGALRELCDLIIRGGHPYGKHR